MSKQQAPPVVELSDVTKQFRDVTAVDDVDLTIREDELLTLLGPSGCGKTTTLRMIAGFEKPSGGVVTITGNSVTDMPPYKRDTGMVFQQYALFPHMTVADNIAFGLEMQGVPDAEIEERVQRALSMVRLEGRGDRYPKELSGGQQQRVALARALIIEPSVLLLDEPLSNLDKKLREEMRLEILRLHRELDVSMVYVTHNQEEALTMSDRMAVMNDGHIHQVGSPEEVYRNPADAFVADFIGNANLLAGTVGDVEDDHYTVELDVGERVRLHHSTAEAIDVEPGLDITLLFRPERFQVHRKSGQGAANELVGKIQETTYLGSRMDYFVRIGETDIHAIQQNIAGDQTFDVGEEVTLSFAEASPFAIPRGAE